MIRAEGSGKPRNTIQVVVLNKKVPSCVVGKDRVPYVDIIKSQSFLVHAHMRPQPSKLSVPGLQAQSNEPAEFVQPAFV